MKIFFDGQLEGLFCPKRGNYDEDYDDYICDMDLDEDELARFLAADTRSCPYWRPGDDYITARKQ